MAEAQRRPRTSRAERAVRVAKRREETIQKGGRRLAAYREIQAALALGVPWTEDTVQRIADRVGTSTRAICLWRDQALAAMAEEESAVTKDQRRAQIRARLRVVSVAALRAGDLKVARQAIMDEALLDGLVGPIAVHNVQVQVDARQVHTASLRGLTDRQLAILAGTVQPDEGDAIVIDVPASGGAPYTNGVNGHGHLPPDAD